MADVKRILKDLGISSQPDRSILLQSQTWVWGLRKSAKYKVEIIATIFQIIMERFSISRGRPHIGRFNLTRLILD